MYFRLITGYADKNSAVETVLKGDRTFHLVHATLDIQLREYTCAAITIPTLYIHRIKEA